MAERPDDSPMTDMVLDFIRNAGGGSAVSGLCRRLLEEQGQGGVCLPVPEEERALLTASILVSTLPNDSRAFIFDPEKGLLYTRRNWKYEAGVRLRIKEMAVLPPSSGLPVPADGIFAQLKECQRRAIRLMAERRFSILTGGPGTGKTYTISRDVALVREQCPEIRRIGLAAPTGKAAARVRESMGGSDVLEATTIHTLLGTNYDFVTFKHDRSHPLPLDWLIIDEASMIDLPLMAKLLDAIGENCKLTLVGDANQLTSVAPGHVFGDLCAMPALRHCVAELTESSRVKDAPEILNLAEAVNRGDAEKVLSLLRNAVEGSVRYYPLDPGCRQEESPHFRESILHHLERFCRQRTPESALEALNDCRVLCAVRKGPYGMEHLNTFIRRAFRQDCPVPLMVTRNDSGLKISNGDVGVLMPEDNALLHLPADDGVRAVPAALIPALEMAFATTIHKSQGSEFDHVVIVLPPVPEGDKPFARSLTRELLYTAITRAKKSVTIFASEDSVRTCCLQRTQRCTGLRD